MNILSTPWRRTLIKAAVLAVILSACVNSSYTPDTPSPALLSTATTESITPTPTKPYTFPVEDVSGQYESPLEFDPGFATLPAGTYLIGEGYSSAAWNASIDTLYYFTMDGAHYGKVGTMVRATLPSGERLPSFRYITTDFDHPSYLRVYSSYWSVDVNDEDRSGLILVQKVDLLSGRTSAYLATPQQGNILCQETRMTVDRHWLYGSCWADGEIIIYLFDLVSGIGKYIYSPQYPCQVGLEDGRWMVLDLPADGMSLEAQCRNEAKRTIEIHCSFSLTNDGSSCRQADYDQTDFFFTPRSPDGSKVAVRVNPDGQQENSYLFITDWECIVDFHACTEYVRAPIGAGDALYYSVSRMWDQTGERFVWTHYPLTADSIQPFTKINIADISTGKITSFDGPRGAVLLSISPDDQWLVLSNNEDLMLLSINGQTLRRLPRPGDRPASFLGWLVIP